MGETHHFREIVRLLEEVLELNRRLNQAAQDSAGEGFPAGLRAEFESKVELFSAAVAQACPEQHERTREELELVEFANRLAARQGTFMPDFEALYRRKAELDGDTYAPRP